MKTKFRITSIHTVFIDMYNEGEQEEANSYILDATIVADDYKDAINQYLQNTLNLNLGFENVEYDEFTQTFETSCLVDADNLQPSESDIKLWQEDKLTLYANIISLKLEIILPFYL